MIVCEKRALCECIRDRCTRTGTGRVLEIAKQIEFSVDVLLSFRVAVLLLRALMHEFARVSQAIIHGAAQTKKTATSQIKLNFYE
jgi:hypothetical protein